MGLFTDKNKDFKSIIRFHLKKLEKQEQIEYKMCRRKEKLKIGAEINEI